MQRMLNEKLKVFTLTEVMMAVVIFGFACSAVLFFRAKEAANRN
jgi:prepilin-type N-terminal cleavage/methylation domain-containing protein